MCRKLIVDIITRCKLDSAGNVYNISPTKRGEKLERQKAQ